MKKTVLIVAAVLLSLSLCGCNYHGIESVDSLLHAPAPADSNEGLAEAFYAAVGKNIKLESPVSGDFYSSFIMRDIDRDGLDESIVLYSDTSNENVAKFVILDEVGGKWTVVGAYTGNGSEVNSVDFADFNGDGVEEIIIAWDYSAQRILKYVTVYGGSAENGIITDFRTLFVEQFSAKKITDVDNDTWPELLIGVVDTENGEYVSIFRVYSYKQTYGRFFLRGEISLDGNITGFYSVIHEADDTVTRFYIDEFIGNDGIQTEIVEWNRKTRRMFFLKKQDGKTHTSDTLRNVKSASLDVDGDGIIEVPVYVECPGSVVVDSYEGVKEALYLNAFLRITGDEYATSDYSVNCFASGIQMNIPEDWIGRVAVVYDKTGNSVRFHRFNAADNKRSVLYASVYPVSQRALEENKNDKLIKLFSAGDMVYCAEITSAGYALGIDKDTLQSLFNEV